MTEPRYPYRYERTHEAKDLQDRFAGLEPGAESETTARVAGRLMTVRRQGKAAFADLKDGAHTIQLFAQQGVLGEAAMDSFTHLRVGDIIGAAGPVIRTRRGELSIKVQEFEVLAPCLRAMPEKWHGLIDIEARYRHRYLDLMLNPEARAGVEARASCNAAIRRHLEQRGFLEVETPLLQPIPGGAVARPFLTHHNALDLDLYLRVAPELYLKRLLIGGFDRVYELNRSFRNEGISARHNPEFTMLEAYEAYADYGDMMALVESLVAVIAEAVVGSPRIQVAGAELNLSSPFRRISMFEAIEEVTGRDLSGAWERDERDELARAAADLEVDVEVSAPAGKLLVEIFEAVAEKQLIEPTFVVGFPKEASPLAKDHRTIRGFTEHADLVLGGVEIAPIYSELNDPQEQRHRFEQQAKARTAGDEEAAVADEEFLEALAYGMPPAGGFGLGVDRLLTLLLGAESIRETILFPILRPSR